MLLRKILVYGGLFILALYIFFFVEQNISKRERKYVEPQTYARWSNRVKQLSGIYSIDKSEYDDYASYTFPRVSGQSSYMNYLLDREIALELAEFKNRNEKPICSFKKGFSTPKLAIIMAIRARLIQLHSFLHTVKKGLIASGECNAELLIAFEGDSQYKWLFTSMLNFWSKRTGLNYKTIEMDSFRKANGLQMLVDKCNPEDIAIILDVDMEIPPNFFSLVRRHTIKRTSVFCPICYSQNRGKPLFISGNKKGTDSLNTEDIAANGFWRIYGLGNIAFYVSDSNIVGGFGNFTKKLTWGREDNYLVDMFRSHDYTIVRPNLQDFYHIWHPKTAWEASSDGLFES